MKAAIVSSFERAPHYGDFAPPTANEGEVVVSVRAAALSQLVKGQAAGTHYSAGGVPFVPGADGVGRLEDGRRVYFAFPRAPYGAMAERSVVSRALCVDVPDGVDDVTAAAIANPGMSSWAGLTERGGFEAGQTVLVHGATGASGRLAVQIAKHLGARRVIATGRTRASVEPLVALGADGVIALDQAPDALAAAFREEAKSVDVVLDYLWGAPAEALLGAFTNGGARRVRYVQIGSLAGGAANVPASALRSSGLELVGSGLGSVPKERLIRAIAQVLNAAVPGRLAIEAEAVALANVEQGWKRGGSARIVFTMESGAPR